DSLVNKLVVVDVSPLRLPHGSNDSLDFMAAMIDALKSIPKMSIVQARKEIDIILSKAIPDEGVRQFLLTNLAEKNKNLCWKANLEVLLKNFNSGIMKFPSVSGSFMKETLFICGEKSPYVKPEEHPQIKTLFPKAEFVTIPGAGHWVHSEKPSEFLETLHNFL
ncbi:Protein ABHD11, partial [Araneus ventricosus]